MSGQTEREAWGKFAHQSRVSGIGDSGEGMWERILEVRESNPDLLESWCRVGDWMRYNAPRFHHTPTPHVVTTVETLEDVLPGIELTREFDVTEEDATIIGEYLAGLGYVLTPAIDPDDEALVEKVANAVGRVRWHRHGLKPLPADEEIARAALRAVTS